MLHFESISVEGIDQIEDRRTFLVFDSDQNSEDAFFFAFLVDLRRQRRVLMNVVVLFAIEFSISNQRALAWFVSIFDWVTLSKRWLRVAIEENSHSRLTSARARTKQVRCCYSKQWERNPIATCLYRENDSANHASAHRQTHAHFLLTRNSGNEKTNVQSWIMDSSSRCSTDCLIEEICRSWMSICIRLPCKQLIERCSRKFTNIREDDDDRCFCPGRSRSFLPSGCLSFALFFLCDQSSIVSVGSQLWQPIDKTNLV